MEAPKFTKPLGSEEGKTLYIEPGVEHVLECDAKGRPTPTIKWFVGGKPLDISHMVNAEFNHNLTR